MGGPVAWRNTEGPIPYFPNSTVETGNQNSIETVDIVSKAFDSHMTVNSLQTANIYATEKDNNKLEQSLTVNTVQTDNYN